MKLLGVKLFVFVFGFWMLITSMSYQGQYEFRTPELFGVGIAEMYETNNYVYGYFNSWGGFWIIYGPENDCRLVQLTGERITGQVNGYVPCTIDLNKWENRGSIDFRDNPDRPFWTRQLEPK